MTIKFPSTPWSGCPCRAPDSESPVVRRETDHDRRLRIAD